MRYAALVAFAIMSPVEGSAQAIDYQPDEALEIIERRTYPRKTLLTPEGEQVLIYEVEQGGQGGPVLRVMANQAIVQLDQSQLIIARDKASPALTIELLGAKSSYYLVTAISKAVLDPAEVVSLFVRQTGVRGVRAGPNIVGKLGSGQDRSYERIVEPWAHANGGNRSGLPLADADVDGSEALSRLSFTRPSGPTIRNPLVMMIDSSIDTAHPALRDNLWVNPGEIPNNGIDDDGNGLRDDVHGWNYVNNNGQLADAEPHGTHVAGIIIANPASNSGAVKGLAVGSKLMTAKVGPKPSSANVIKAINYAIGTRASVINMSLSFDLEPLGLAEAIAAAEQANIISVAAAGNDGNNLQQKPVWPCMYALVVCVGMTNDLDELDSRSNWFASSGQLGTAGVAIAAPGVAIQSTAPGGGYRSDDGTSMAAPMVAGAIAAVLRQFPTETHNDVRWRVLNTADRVPTLPGDKVEQGRRLNLYRALFGAPRREFATDDYCNIPIRDPETNQSHPRRTNSPFANSGEQGVDGLSPTTAFTICSVAQLINIQDSFLDKIFVLKTDLVWTSDTSGSSAYNIGGRTGAPRAFTGIFDGGGHTIERLGEGQMAQRVGLIAELGRGGRVSNLRLAGVRIATSGFAGAVAKSMRGGRIDNVQADGQVSGSFAGGLVADAQGGTITLSTFEGRVSGKFATGGLVGQMLGPDAAIESSGFNGVVASRSYVGGLVGRAANQVKIGKSYATLHVPSEGAFDRREVGGLAGSLECRSRIEDSFAEGEIASSRYTGSLVGILINADIARAFGSVLISTDNDTSGGAVGLIQDDARTGQIYTCSGTTTLPPPSTRIDDRFDSFMGGTGNGIATSPTDLRKSVTYSNWPMGLWDIENGFLPRLKNMPRSTHQNY